jgi:hypothetical protein
MFIALSQRALGGAFGNMIFRNDAKVWRTDAASVAPRQAKDNVAFQLPKKTVFQGNELTSLTTRDALLRVASPYSDTQHATNAP